ncbi:isoprenylcysteine alpha-carbonyl methylesterase ICME-like [Pecten maximus]|uniref:isoprenylcysteine alpha-carbonyl methylesterase ICME-like n=1 Tax=Pecten maximus TaxID=6579 RepID=UPI001458B78A|nr:isoprenylcysteine alpha-carbonyl methylesterase ICME-like [Pecten maximus]
MSKMLRNVAKCVMVLASSAVVIPYTISILCNILNGWPQTKHKFQRAFHPKKVYAMNYAVLQKLVITLRYFPRYIQWKIFYRSADVSKLRKNFVYGRNNRNLDLYVPGVQGLQPSRPHPVLVFVYGGAWSSGDKNMYGMLCSELADRLQVLVCCPNYSIYPQGFVDDMVQDVVDCVSWAYQNIEMYGGDKERIMLVGHSAGAHLCMMTVLELLHDELVQGSNSQSQLLLQESLRFQDSHFDSNKRSRIDTLDESSGSSGSFCVLNDNGDKGGPLESGGATSMYEMISVKSDQDDNGSSSEQGAGYAGIQYKDDDEEEEAPDSQGGAMNRQVSQDVSEVTQVRVDVTEVSAEGVRAEEVRGEEVRGEEVTEVRGVTEEAEEEEHSENESIVTIRPSDHQPTLLELGKSIKAIVGLAGVYDISDHFEHEYMRGVEDVSKMARAMYGNEHFDRFSPSSLVRTLSSSVSLPPVVLIHGTDDYVVPLSSTTKLAEAIQEIYGDVTVRIIPGCDHFSLCLDIMDSKSRYYESVLGVILETAAKVLK